MGAILYKWRWMVFGATVLAAMLLLIGMSAARAASERPRGESAATPQTPPKNADPNSPSFADKPADGWRGERRRLEQAGLEVSAILVLEGFKNSVAD